MLLFRLVLTVLAFSWGSEEITKRRVRKVRKLVKERQEKKAMGSVCESAIYHELARQRCSC